MLASGFSFKWNNKNLKKVTDAQRQALEKTAVKMIAEKIQQQEIPLKEGTLQNIATQVDDAMLDQGKLSIVHETPYAKNLYYNPQFNFNQEFNTNAKGEWWEDFITGAKKDRPKKLYEWFLKQQADGVIK